jgi:DNA-binding GntR family transcriptional regulator
MKVGDRLPSIAELMRQYGVSITVVRMALSELRGEGLIATHQGKGAFVLGTPKKESSADDELMSLKAEVRDLAARVSALEASVSR